MEKEKAQTCNRTDISPKLLGRMAVTLKVLAHPCRLGIVNYLEGRGEAPVFDITAYLGIPQAATSHHLRAMKRVGLIESSRKGKEIWYRIKDESSLTILSCIRSKKKS